MSTLENKIAGAIYGFAIGDAMGATTEFLTSGQIRNRFESVTDIIGGGWLNLKAGEVTDDTQMTMCVMDALMKYPNNLEIFEKHAPIILLHGLIQGLRMLVVNVEEQFTILFLVKELVKTILLLVMVV